MTDQISKFAISVCLESATVLQQKQADVKQNKAHLSAACIYHFLVSLSGSQLTN